MYEKLLCIHLNNFQRIFYAALSTGYCMARSAGGCQGRGSTRACSMNYRAGEQQDKEHRKNSSFSPTISNFLLQLSAFISIYQQKNKM